MLRQVYDPEEAGRILNHPEVIGGASLGLTDYFDPSPLFENPLNICLMDDIGGFFCLYEGEGIFDCHSFFIPEGRGREAVRVARESIKYMFDVAGAQQLVGWSPVENRAVRAFSRMAGFKIMGIEPHRFYPEGEEMICEKSSYLRSDFKCRQQ